MRTFLAGLASENEAFPATSIRTLAKELKVCERIRIVGQDVDHGSV